MTPNRYRQLASRAALVACLSVGVIACGDDDDDTDASTEDDGGTNGEQAAGGGACDAIVEFNGTVTNVDTEAMSEDEMKSAGEELAGIWEGVVEGAPDAVADDAAELATVLDDLAAGDPEAFDSDATFETYTGVLDATVAECDFETVSATAVDYGFEGIPETVPAGTVALQLENSSESEMHEMIIFQKPEGDTRSAEELLNDPAMEESGPPPVGFVFAPPGETSTGLAELEAGSYFAVCFIPVGGGEDGPPHFTEGMLAEFTVE